MEKEVNENPLKTVHKAIEMRYESNPKHSDPWQPGRKGSICDQEVRPHVTELLIASEVDGDKRYAVFDGRAYCAQQHQPGVWHGYPVGWIEVPYRLQKLWKSEGKVNKRQIKQHKEAHS
ncbi:MAG: hypothetical protein SGI77_19510 [Pirellulaceae bacterium]|nr:hypothetical protein [Pirellulaceae bacterium]